MDTATHREITRKVIPASWRRTKCCDDGDDDEIRPRHIVNDASASQDDLCGQFHNEYHGDNGALAPLSAYIKQQWDYVRTWESMQQVRSCCDCELMKKALECLGRIFHGVQDFYSHSNWVETYLPGGKMPLWDPESGAPAGITSGSWPLGGSTPGGGPAHGFPLFKKDGDLAKDSDTDPEGKQIYDGKTLHEWAKEFALLGTFAEYEKFRKRAPNIIRCIEKPLNKPCGPCRVKAAMAVRTQEERLAAILPPRHEPLIETPDPAGALAAAADALMTNRPIPSTCYETMASLTVAELKAMARRPFDDPSSISLGGRPLGAWRFAEAVVLLEAVRLASRAAAMRLVEELYDDDLPGVAKGLLIETAARTRLKSSRRFLLERLWDDAWVTRESRAYEIAAAALEKLLRVEVPWEELADPILRGKLKRLWSVRSGIESEPPSEQE